MKSDPKFCIIAPTAYLTQYSDQSSHHLALAHLVDTDEEYARFYKEMSDGGDFIIMDNGAFELGESYSPILLIELGNKIGASAIVLPDYPAQPPQKTIRAAEDLIPHLHDAGFQTFFCPQAEVGDLAGWVRAYEWAANNDDIEMIGMSILAIPNALPHIPKSYSRVVMTQMLIDRGVFNFDKYHHYLGLNAGPNLEIPALRRMNVIDSCDSSNPVWAGIHGLRYDSSTDSYLTVRKEYMREVDFAEPWSKKPNIHEAIQHNLDLTMELFGEEE